MTTQPYRESPAKEPPPEKPFWCMLWLHKWTEWQSKYTRQCVLCGHKQRRSMADY